MQTVERQPGVGQEAAASLSEVSKLYGNFAALRKVTVEFAPGSCTMVLGDNGAGKSTLLRVLAGLISPTHGAVKVFNDEPHNQRRRVAYMSHEAMLYDELSALENLRYFARLQAQRGECACGGPERSLRAVGLDPLLKRPVGQYSQGMRQRASLARVLQADPELLLLDEPFSNLDVDSARRMVELLVEFRSWPVIGATNVTGAADDQTLRGRTIILTTHQAHLAEPLAETTLTMRGGAVASMISRATSDPAQAKEDAR